MIVKCAYCERRYDDQFRWTFCPHDTFAANDGKNNFAHHPESKVIEAIPEGTFLQKLKCCFLGCDTKPITDFMSPQEIKDALVRTEGNIEFWSKCARCGEER